MRFKTWSASVAVALVLTSCLEADEPKGAECSATCSAIQAAKTDLADGRFAQAIDRCTKVLAAEPKNSDARYCILIGRVGLLAEGVNSIFDSINGIVGPYMSPLSPSRFQAQMDYKHFIDDWAAKIEDDMKGIDEQVFYLAAQSDATFNVAHVPIVLHVPSGFTDGFKTMAAYDVVEIDLGGTWDDSEVLVLGASLNLTQAAIDYVLAHDFTLVHIPSAAALDQFVAGFFIENPKFLGFAEDEISTARLFGDEDRKGMRRDLIAGASYLAGRADSLEGVAGRNGGLREAIQRSAAADVTDAVLQWIDDDGDGNPEAIEGSLIAQVSKLLVGVALPRAPMPLSSDTFNALYDFAGATRDNAENGSDPVATQALLDGLRTDMGNIVSYPLFEKEVPDVLALDPDAFLEQPLSARQLLPYFWSRSGYGIDYGLLGEWEVYGSPTYKRRFNFSNGYYENISSNAGIHFDTVNASAFGLFPSLPDLTLADDGVGPTADVNQIPVIAMQYPSLGGLLHLNLAALGGTASGEATHASLNEAIARLAKYYCVHTYTDNNSIFNGRTFDMLSTCTN